MKHGKNSGTLALTPARSPEERKKQIPRFGKYTGPDLRGWSGYRFNQNDLKR
jgi:hypothetical protein